MLRLHSNDIVGALCYGQEMFATSGINDIDIPTVNRHIQSVLTSKHLSSHMENKIGLVPVNYSTLHVCLHGLGI